MLSKILVSGIIEGISMSTELSASLVLATEIIPASACVEFVSANSLGATGRANKTRAIAATARQAGGNGKQMLNNFKNKQYKEGLKSGLRGAGNLALGGFRGAYGAYLGGKASKIPKALSLEPRLVMAALKTKLLLFKEVD